MNDALGKVDRAIGELMNQLDMRKVNLLLVSDHGMATVPSADNVLELDDYMPEWPKRVSWIDFGPVTSIFPLDEKVEEDLKRTIGRHPMVQVLTKAEYPREWHYADGARIPPIIALCDVGYTLTYRKAGTVGKLKMRGFHGYDPSTADMQAIIVGAGADIQPASNERSKQEQRFESVDLYGVLARLLKVPERANNGTTKLADWMLTDQ